MLLKAFLDVNRVLSLRERLLTCSEDGCDYDGMPSLYSEQIPPPHVSSFRKNMSKIVSTFFLNSQKGKDQSSFQVASDVSRRLTITTIGSTLTRKVSIKKRFLRKKTASVSFECTTCERVFHKANSMLAHLVSVSFLPFIDGKK